MASLHTSSSHASQASPMPSRSSSACESLASRGQLSVPLRTPSPSMSLASSLGQVPERSGHGSHSSPLPSLSASACLVSNRRTGLNTVGHLSEVFLTPSQSLSALVTPFLYVSR